MAAFVEMLPIVFLLGLIYLMLIRPQNKRAKEQKKMLESLTRGDEVVTSGGLLGKIMDVGDNFVLIDLGGDIKVKVQRQAISNTVPKGTVKSPL
ncbi:MAG: preprotein translocase subunit YajC [Pseudomonadota bacterium]|nr:preprotein translocase subunit YajC [Pseudomonadota bacterium]